MKGGKSRAKSLGRLSLSQSCQHDPPNDRSSYYSRTGRVKGFRRGQERSNESHSCVMWMYMNIRPALAIKWKPKSDFFFVPFHLMMMESRSIVCCFALSLSIFDVHYTNVTAMMMIPKCIHCSLISTSESGENCTKKNWIERLVNDVTVSSTSSIQ